MIIKTFNALRKEQIEKNMRLIMQMIFFIFLITLTDAKTLKSQPQSLIILMIGKTMLNIILTIYCLISQFLKNGSSCFKELMV